MPPMALCGEATPLACPPQALLAHTRSHHRALSGRIPGDEHAALTASAASPSWPTAPGPRRHSSTHSSRKPAPAAYPPSGHDSVISQPGSPKATYSQSACSNSNTSRDARASVAQSLPAAEDDEKRSLPPPAAAAARDPPKPARDSMVQDLEKQSYSPTTNSRRSNRNHLPVAGQPADLYYAADPDEVVHLEDKALKILLHLSGFACLVSIAVSLWTLVAVVLAALLQPLRFCSMRPDYREQLVKFLAPSLTLQFRLIYSTPLSSMYNTPLLLLIHLLSPFVAIGVAIAAWISASFWIYAAIIGDPGSKDAHNDGRESVLIVRSYWERWLLKALR